MRLSAGTTKFVLNGCRPTWYKTGCRSLDLSFVGYTSQQPAMSPAADKQDCSDAVVPSLKHSESSFTLASTLGWTPGSRTPASILSKADSAHHLPQEVFERLKRLELEVDGHGTVQWLPGSIAHPRQWPLSRKLYDTTVICILEFFTTLISNTGSSVARYASEDIGIDQELAIFCFVTLYLFGQAVGGLLFPPIAESFGGRQIYIAGAVGFAASCVLLGASPTLPAAIIGRFLSGFFSAMPTVVAVGSLVRLPAQECDKWADI